MSIGSKIESALGLTDGRKIRYAIVGLGDIAQAAMLPGIDQTGNSEVTALVTGDPEKARELGERYNVSNLYSYEQFGELLQSGKIDAIYLATPNFRHAEFAVPALKAGIHVLLEKPMEVTSEQCQAIIDAQTGTNAKLMIAYRLHFEPATLSTIEMIRSGELGKVHTFTATFSQFLDPKNHRAKHGIEAGPLYDMGPYPINASRYVFESEPIEVVSAIGVRHPEAGLGDLDDTVAVTLRFSENRIAQFTVSYYANSVDSFFAVGTEGSIQMNPAFGFGKSLEQFITIGEKKTHHSHKATDQFSGEMHYFSNCILNDLEIEPDGQEGLADVHILEAIKRALETGTPQKIEPFARVKRIETELQEERFGQSSKPKDVNASHPSLH